MVDKQSPPVNRRAAPRRVPQASTKVECRRGNTGLGPNLALRLVNISQVGAAILIQQELAQSAEVEVSLAAATMSKPVKILANVARAQPAESEGQLIGVRFRRPLTSEELGRMV